MVRDGVGDHPAQGGGESSRPVAASLAAGLVVGLLLSPNLWVSARTYPLTPLWDVVLPLPYPADYTLFGLFVALVAGMGVTRGRMAG